MIDRIEELLSGMAAEEDDEEQEDVLALTRTAAVTASPQGEGGEAGEVPETADGKAEPAPVKPGERDGGRTAGKIAAERAGRLAGDTAPERLERPAGETVLEQSGRLAGETAPEQPERQAGEVTVQETDKASEKLRKAGAVWNVRSGSAEVDAARGLALAEQMEQAAETLRTVRDGEREPVSPAERAEDLELSGLEWVVRTGTAEGVADGLRRMTAAQAGLEGLYRQTVEAARPAAPALPPERAGRTARAQEPGSAASLAVDELDRAVRRDSRRYDGGMSIF